MTTQPEIFEISNEHAENLILTSVAFKPDLAAMMQLIELFPPKCKGERKRKFRVINESGALLVLFCNICRLASRSYILTGPADLLAELTYNHYE